MSVFVFVCVWLCHCLLVGLVWWGALVSLLPQAAAIPTLASREKDCFTSVWCSIFSIVFVVCTYLLSLELKRQDPCTGI